MSHRPSRTAVSHDTDYRCSTCGTWWPVRVVARDCETKHQREESR